ncbi:MAG: hypothetical protein AAFQ79_02460 [Pseudomonadota bacterium]
MAKRKFKNFKIDDGQIDPSPVVDVSKREPSKDIQAGVSLRYFERKQECFSKWQKRELVQFSGFVEKMANRTEAQVTSVTKTCHAHKGMKGKKLPAEVSPDVKMYSLDVGPKGRVHGFFFSGKFFLVWLDREGAILGH